MGQQRHATAAPQCAFVSTIKQCNMAHQAAWLGQAQSRLQHGQAHCGCKQAQAAVKHCSSHRSAAGLSMSHLGAVAQQQGCFQLLDLEVTQVCQVLLGPVQICLQLVQACLCRSQLHVQAACNQQSALPRQCCELVPVALRLNRTDYRSNVPALCAHTPAGQRFGAGCACCPGLPPAV